MKPLHACIVCDEYPPDFHGGTGASYRDLAEGMVEMGHRVTVVGTPWRREDGVVEETLNGVRVIRLPIAPRWWNYRIWPWWERRQLRRWLRKVHAETPLDFIEGTDFRGRLSSGGVRGVPIIIRIRGSNLFFDAELNREPCLFDQKYERAALERADHLAAVSHYAAKRTLEVAGLSGRRCTVIHNAVDTDYFSPGKPEEIEPGHLVYVNSINPKKGIEELVDAVNEIFPNRPHARLTAIGSDTQHRLHGQYVENLLARVKPEWRERVVFAGRLEKEAVRGMLRRAAVCCYPSHIETFGIAPLEAMSVGRPVIFMKNGPGPEIVEDGISGLLCDSHDAADLARMLVRLLDEPAEAEAMGKRARQRVLERFEKRAWLERNIAYYRACVSGSDPSM